MPWYEKPLPSAIVAWKPGTVLSSGEASTKVAVSPLVEALPSRIAMVFSGIAALE